MSGVDLLKQHLEWVEQDKLEVSENFFSRNVEEKVEYESFMDDYVLRVKMMLSSRKYSKIDREKLPYVLMTSIVSVEDLEDGEVMDFKIVSPNESEQTCDAISASYLSPMGRAMLLKSIDEHVTIKTPTGVFKYKIKNIKA